MFMFVIYFKTWEINIQVFNVPASLIRFYMKDLQVRSGVQPPASAVAGAEGKDRTIQFLCSVLTDEWRKIDSSVSSSQVFYKQFLITALLKEEDLQVLTMSGGQFWRLDLRGGGGWEGEGGEEGESVFIWSRPRLKRRLTAVWSDFRATHYLAFSCTGCCKSPLLQKRESEEEEKEEEEQTVVDFVFICVGGWRFSSWSTVWELRL